MSQETKSGPIEDLSSLSTASVVEGNGDSEKTPDTRGRSKEASDSHSRQILAAILAFRDGNFGVRLPANWLGIDGRIAAAFNQTIDHEEHISKEIARLSVSVGKEGRLKQRVSVPGLIGGWAAKAESVNTLLDDLVRPTSDVARTIGAVAKGDLANRWNWKWTARAEGRVPAVGEAGQYDD